MRHLNETTLASLSPGTFRTRSPYPWVNPQGVLTEQSYDTLLHALPEPQLFEEHFGEARRYGQRSHDRLALEYRDDLSVPAVWHELVAELRGPTYREFLGDMLGTSGFELRFHWHYTPTGCSVSPHCDAKRKLGSHIFYFNTAADWDPAWGGETLILDDEGRFSRKSAPGFEDFSTVIRSDSLGNRSLLFRRRGNSWHGVEALRCPSGRYRKVFIVVIDAARDPALRSWKRWFVRRR